MHLELDVRRLVHLFAGDLGELLHSEETVVFFAQPDHGDAPPK